VLDVPGSDRGCLVGERLALPLSWTFLATAIDSSSGCGEAEGEASAMAFMMLIWPYVAVGEGRRQ
jgi:hypothetical protein